jgi:hypothetical protein
VRIPAGSTVRLRLRNLWLREAPMARTLEVAPRFHDFRVDVHPGDAATGSWLDLPLEPVTPKLACATAWLDLETMAPLTVALRAGSALAEQRFFTTAALVGDPFAPPCFGEEPQAVAGWLPQFTAASMQGPWFVAFEGHLDDDGNAESSLDLSFAAPLPMLLSGMHLRFESFVWDGAALPDAIKSNPCDVLLR